MIFRALDLWNYSSWKGSILQVETTLDMILEEAKIKSIMGPLNP